MVFDPAWKECLRRGELENKSVDERIETVINHLNDHPFVQSEPTQARQVAQFRVRLLELWAAETTLNPTDQAVKRSI